MTEKRFTVIYNEHSEMMQYVDNQKEEPNRWAIWNARETARKLNDLNDENEQLKKRNKRLEEKIQRERTSFTKTHERWSKEAETKIKELAEENEQLKKENQRLDDILGKECINEYSKLLGDTILKEMHDEKYGGKE